MRRWAGVLGLVVVISAVPAYTAAAQPSPETVDVVVVLKDQVDLDTGHTVTRADRLATVEQRLRAHAAHSQRRILRVLRQRRAQHQVTSVSPLWIANEIEVRATPDVVRELAARSDVQAVRPNAIIQAPVMPAQAAASSTAVEPNVGLVNAPAMWAQGLRGQGVVVANMDTGVDVSHPDLSAKWRGGTNSWYDPNGQHPSTPTDVSGHGTWTMGVMVGGNASGSSVGVAPDAKWIAVKIFDDRGRTTSTAIHQGFQWLLDPDGNLATPDAPNVINNSWTMSASGCNLDFQPDLRSLRAAGILPVFAAGNDGPAASTVFSPANLPEAFAVGSTDNTDVGDPYSSRGPSACAGATSPELVAPGVGLRTTDLYAGYATETGTSMAAPHVAGGLALLLSGAPHLTADQQEAALEAGAVDLGPTGVDPQFGYGRLDVSAAYRSISMAPDFAIASSPSSVAAAAGSTAAYTVTVTPSQGFIDNVAISATGLSAAQGSITVSPSVVTGGSGAAQVSVVTASSLAPGGYPLTFTGTSGATSHSVTSTLVVPAPPDFTASASPASTAVSAGGIASFSVAISALNGFGGDVMLSPAGLPARVGTAAYTPSVVRAAGTASLVVNTAAAAAAGSYPLTVVATSGSITHTASVSLVVTRPDFTVKAAPSTRTVYRGQNTTYTVTVTPSGGFTGSTTVSVAGLPAGSSASVSPNPIAASGSATLRLRTTSSTPRGTFTIRITATSGALNHQATITLVVR